MSGGSVASRSSSSPTITSRPGSHSSTASEKQGVPRVGGVRCYWAFLSPRRPDPSIPGSKLELMFVHLDPVLAVHMAAQKMSLLGRGILEFIHPGEREDARRDLTNAIASDDLQGSVTRVRFARLSCIRKILGSKPEDLELPFDASSFTEDDEYLILDLVLNWVADGLLLAFFHAIRDKDPVANNDRNKQHEEWSNFCGTAKMGAEQVAALQADIEACLPPVPRSRFPPTRVLQLHTSINHSNTSGGLLFTWPPARPPDRQSLVPLYDGMYQAEEYVGLMAGVSLDPQQHLVNESRTNCTTRYGAKHSINSEGLYRHIVSVFIPYGNIIFACFQTVKQVELVQRVSIGVQPSPYPPPAQEWPSSDATDLAAETRDSDPDYGIVTPRNQDWEYSAPMESSWSGEHVKSDDYAQLPVHPAGPSYDIHGHQSQHLSAPHPHHGSHHQQAHSEHYRNASAPQLTSNHHQISHPGHLTHSSSLPLSQSDPANGFQRFEMNSFPAASRSPYDHNVSIPPPGSDQYPREPGYPPTGTYALEDDSPPSAAYAKPHTRVLSEDGGGEEHGGANAHSGNGGGSSSRPMIRPPGDIERCRICGTTESPEWRRSEAGIKDLCNACGLRLARQVAKREGRQKPRKKKDK